MISWVQLNHNFITDSTLRRQCLRRFDELVVDSRTLTREVLGWIPTRGNQVVSMSKTY